MKASTILLVTVLLAASASALDLQTNSIYRGSFNVANPSMLTFIDCAPRMTGDLASQDWVRVQPPVFSLDPGEAREVIVTFDKPRAGQYSGAIQIVCEQYDGDEYVRTSNILASGTEPRWSITVTQAGANETYEFTTGRTYNFVAEPGSTERASVTIRNLGEEPLPVSNDVTIDYISIEPSETTIPGGDTASFTITVDTPSTFTTLDTTATFNIGDYEDTVRITGALESLTPSGPALASIAGQTVNVGPARIPTPVIIIVIIIVLLALWRNQDG